MIARRLLRWEVAVPVLLVAALARLLLVVVRLSAQHVNEDQASVLLAARELLRGRVHQPSFPGQHYGVVFEGLGAAVGQLVGVPPVLGLTATLALLWYAGWLLVAAGAWHAGARAVAVLAAGMPLLLSVYPVYYSSVFATGVGRLLGVAAAVLLWRCRLVPLAVGFGLLAVVFDPSSALLPLVGAALGGRALLAAARPRLLAIAVAVQPALLWAAWRRRFAATHPDHGLHAAPSLDPSWSGLQEVAGRTPDYAQAFAAALLPGGWPVLLLTGAVLLACLVLGSWRLRLAAVLLVGVAALMAATPRALDDVSMFLPGARVFLGVPYAVLLLAAALEAQRAPVRLARVGVAAAAALVLLSALAGAVRWESQSSAILAAAPTAPVVALVPVDELEARCRAAAALDAELVVYLDDRPAAYGCPVLVQDGPPTLLPSYERRTWRLYAEQTAVRTSLAVVGNPGLCDAAAGLVCRPLPGALPAVLVEPAGRPTLEVLRLLGIGIRPFGPGCTPTKPETC